MAATLDNLPIELVFYIFKFLNIKDKLSCRLVSKKFKCVIEEMKIDEVAIGTPAYLREDKSRRIWLSSNKQISLSNAIEFSKILPLKAAFKLNQNLKSLFIDYLKGTHYELAFLNGLAALEKLHIRSHERGHYKFNLASLKIFQIDFCDEQDRIYLKAPKLEVLKSDLIDPIKIANPATLKYLSSDYYEDKTDTFKNLEYLEILKSDEYVNANILKEFKNLKEMRLYFTCMSFTSNYVADRELINNFKYIMKQKLVLRRIDFKLYLQGVQIENKNVFDAIYSSDFEFQMKNYECLIDHIPVDAYEYEPKIDYCELIKFKPTLPTSFFTKFSVINKVKAKARIDNSTQFICFLKNLHSLEDLNLKNTFISDQKFYNQLGDLHKLKYLKLAECSKLTVNYNFILKLKCLLRFVIRHECANPFDLGMNAFKRLKNFNFYEFKNKQDRILIKRDYQVNSKFELRWYYTNRPELSEVETFKPIRYDIKIEKDKLTAYELTVFYNFLNDCYNDGEELDDSIVTRHKNEILYKLLAKEKLHNCKN